MFGEDSGRSVSHARCSETRPRIFRKRPRRREVARDGQFPDPLPRQRQPPHPCVNRDVAAVVHQIRLDGTVDGWTMSREGRRLPGPGDWEIPRILRPPFVPLMARNAAHGDRVQRGRGVEQRRAGAGQVVRVLGTPVAGTIVVAAVVPRRHDEEHVELAAERIQRHG